MNESETPGRLSRAEQRSVQGKQYYAIWWLRRHPDIAAYILLGIYLKPHQRVCLRGMFRYPNLILLLSRGMSKTFLVAVYCILRCMLWSGSSIVALGPGMKQNRMIFEEAGIAPLIDGKREGQKKRWFARRCVPSDSRVLVRRRESIMYVPFGHAKPSLVLSTALGRQTEAELSAARGLRANTALILDERNLIPDEVIEAVIKPMGRVARGGFGVGDSRKLEQVYNIRVGTLAYDWQSYAREVEDFRRRMVEGDPSHMLYEYNYEDAFYWIDGQQEATKSGRPVVSDRLVFTYPVNLHDVFQAFEDGLEDEAWFLAENKNVVIKERSTEFPAQLIHRVSYSRPDDKELVPCLTSEEPGVLGVDPATLQDEAAFVWVMAGSRRHPSVGYSQVRYAKRIRARSVPNGTLAILETIRDIFRRFPNTFKAVIDGRGGGQNIADLLRDPGAGQLMYYDPSDDTVPALIREQGIPLLRVDMSNVRDNTDRVFSIRSAMQSETFLLVRPEFRTGDEEMDELYRTLLLLGRQFTYIQGTPVAQGMKYDVQDTRHQRKDLFSATLLAWSEIYAETIQGQRSQEVSNYGVWV